MCGILGAMPKQNPILFEKALSLIAHRGPDGFGIWNEDEKISLGHRRLSILDLSEAGKQPMTFLERYTITFNGEIFNFLEIKKELLQKGYSFVSESDTEVILAAFNEWKEKCLDKFNGMWAFAIWDKNEQTLFLARDRFGIKPLYYSFNEKGFVFASEMKAIFPFLKEVKPSSDFEWCQKNIFKYEATDKTLIEGIKRFPAGHYAFFKKENTEKKELKPIRFWETLDNLVEVPKTYQEQVEKFRELFLDACKLRMRSDVRIGTALSGGMDSSAVICGMAAIQKQEKDARVANDWQNAFVACFKDTPFDESVYAKEVTDYLGINGVFEEISPTNGIDNLEDYLWLFEDIYLTSPIPMVEIYKTIKKNGVTVSIDGHGADELLSSYGNRILLNAKDTPFSVSKIKHVLKLYEGLSEQKNTSFKKRLSTLIDTYGGRKPMILHYINSLTGSSFDDNLGNGLASTNPELQKQLGFFTAQLYEDFHQTILPTLLRNYDRYSMAASVEVRMPFMDYRLASYCFSLPAESKIKNGYTKSILRDAMKDNMPQNVVWRKPKTGFNTPIVQWLQGDWKEFILDNLESTAFQNSDLINQTDVKKQVLKVTNTPNIAYLEGEKAWEMLMPYFWEKSVIKRKIN
ncbi:asparagine synthase (glutamine-hydrolyzing) [Bernardetia sp. OM2101]|uniref:asparagine synthase (glutamine-hydrolyzing) n=1 Tax=Bernardetia sp. OM2101 TaxID=3344876 RepID=UPI0035CF7865